MTMVSELVELETGARLATDLTSTVRRFCADKGDGLCHLFVPHATAGVALMELGSGSEEDLARLLDRFLPREEPYVHRHGSAGHGRDHLVPAFLSPSIVLPVQRGEVLLGTWQSVVLIDTNRDNPHRQVRLSFLASA
jgi:secondary thiamine-phosphate synthase enzyme